MSLNVKKASLQRIFEHHMQMVAKDRGLKYSPPGVTLRT